MTISKKLTKKIRLLKQFWGKDRSLRERVQSVAHLLTGNVLTSLIGLLGFALTARALGPSAYGILALCFTFTSAVERIVSFQSWQPLIKYGVQSEEAEAGAALKELIKFGFLLDISAAFAGWLIAVGLVLSAGRWIGISEESSNLAILYCSVLPFQISGTPMAVLRLFGRFRSIAYGQVISSLTRLALCLVGILAGGGLFEFIVIWMVAQIAGSLTFIVFALIELRRRGLIKGLLAAPLRGITARFPGLWKFAVSTNLSLTIRSSANQIDTLLVGYLADPASAGLYHIAKRIGRIAQQAGDQVQAVLYPELARDWARGSLVEFRRAAFQTQGLLLACGILLVGVLYLSIEPLLRWAAGPEFAPAAPLVLVQAVAVTVTLIGTVTRSALLAMGREDRVLQIVLISTIAFHATALLLIPSMGPMGANVAHIVMASIWLAMMTIVYNNAIGKAAY